MTGIGSPTLGNRRGGSRWGDGGLIGGHDRDGKVFDYEVLLLGTLDTEGMTLRIRGEIRQRNSGAILEIYLIRCAMCVFNPFHRFFGWFHSML